MSKLTDKHARFVAEYLIDANATQAAIRAGYSQKTARQQGQRLLTNVDIKAAIRRRQARVEAEAEVSAAATLRELGRIGYFDIGELFRPDGSIIPIHKLPRAVRAAVSRVEIVLKNATAGDDKIDRVLKVWTHDKTPALTQLGKHFGLFVEKIELKDVTAEARVARLVAARRRVAQLAGEPSPAKP
jgi:phage terminase small subunit